MGAVKTYLEEASFLVKSHKNWSMESLVNQFRKSMNCDEGTAIYFIEKAIEENTYYWDGEYDRI